MNKKTLIFGLAILALVGGLLLSVTGTADAQGGPRHGRGNGAGGTGFAGSSQRAAQTGAGYGTGTGLQVPGMDLPPAVEGDLPADVVEALNAALQDEYHAYAVYEAVIEQFGAVRPFVNIRAAEAQHIAALEILFERYGLEVPAPQPLDEALTFASVTEACALGAEAEIANFSLYDGWLATVSDYPDIVQVFTALRDASEFSHLPAFERCAG